MILRIYPAIKPQWQQKDNHYCKNKTTHYKNISNIASFGSKTQMSNEIYELLQKVIKLEKPLEQDELLSLISKKEFKEISEMMIEHNAEYMRKLPFATAPDGKTIRLTRCHDDKTGFWYRLYKAETDEKYSLVWAPDQDKDKQIITSPDLINNAGKKVKEYLELILEQQLF